jgi:hypothetical protein
MANEVNDWCNISAGAAIDRQRRVTAGKVYAKIRGRERSKIRAALKAEKPRLNKTA